MKSKPCFFFNLLAFSCWPIHSLKTPNFQTTKCREKERLYKKKHQILSCENSELFVFKKRSKKIGMEEEYSRIPMGRTTKIMRTSMYVFFKNYQYLSTTATFLGIPFAVLVLLSEASLPSSSLFRVIHGKIQALFDAAGFPRSSEFFTILNLKLSQTISTSFLVLPFSLSFLLLAKAFVIQEILGKRKQGFSFPSFLTLYSPLFSTQICNILVIISANATCFCFLLFMFNFIEGLGISNSRSLLFFSATGAVLYSIVLANVLIICNLALILSGKENSGGYMAILKACVLIRGRTATGLSLTLPVTLVLAGVEALFQYRIVRAYREDPSISSAMAIEGMLLAYLYSILLVLDTVVSCIFYRSCKRSSRRRDQENGFLYRFQGREYGTSISNK